VIAMGEGARAALAAFSGVIAAPVFNAFATVGDKMLILGFMTVILGGLGSLRGAIAAAFLVGLTLVVGEGTFRSRERRVAAQILFYTVAVAAHFPVFERTNVLLHPLDTATPSQKPVIYKGHKGGISRRNWTCVVPMEGHFHPRDMSLKTISSFVAC